MVTTSNGEFSTKPYRLKIELADSGLLQAPPPPEVAVRLQLSDLPTTDVNAITTLYLYNGPRMADVYGVTESDPNLLTIAGGLDRLSNINGEIVGGAPIEKGAVINLGELRAPGNTSTMTDVYQLWDANKDNPFYANYVAGVIDNVIEAVTTDGVSGPGATGGDLFVGASDTIPPIFFPNLRNVVLVGGDEIIPHYRLPDLTEIANESEYADYLKSIDANGIIRSDSALGAALRYRMLLTDNVYGAGKPYRFYGFPFFVPSLAVGRIVENPDQIARFVDYYANNTTAPAAFQIDVTSFGGANPPKRAFISGYDFLKDQAGAIGGILLARGLQPAEFNALNNDSWRRADLEQSWFDGALDTEFPDTGFVSDTANIDLSSVNAHFDHWQLLPAVHSTTDQSTNFPALRMLSPQYTGSFPQLYFGGTLGYSVGCHSGYNVFDGAIFRPAGRVAQPAQTYDPAVYEADFAQALNSHGGNWVGNTGYGYGTADGIDYSERLAVLYTQELVRAVLPSIGGASIGEALVNAKQRYVRNSASLTAYDYKVVNVMNLYGLPFVRVQTLNPLAPPAEDPTPDGNNVPLETPAPTQPSNLGRLTRTITFTINVDVTDFKDVARTGSQIFDLDPADFTVVDEFDQRGPDVFRQQVRTFTNNQVGVPNLPTFAYDIGALNSDGSERLKVLDVVFLNGVYSNRGAFNPQITQVATETLDVTPLVSTTDEPNFAAGAGVWYPDKFFGFSSVGDGEQQRDQLTSFAAQFRGDAGGVTGLLRPYTQMVFRVTYDDPSVRNPAADALDGDNQPPLIQSVRVQAPGAGINLAQNQAVLVVKASDTGPDADADGANQGLAEVSAIYVKGGVSWEPVTLIETPAGSGIFTANVPLKPGEARFIVRATDAAGNTSYYTAKGRFTPRTTAYVPLVIR